jgi:tetratricopeptide (TPR) repeat protein
MRKFFIKILPVFFIITNVMTINCIAQSDGYFQRVAMVSDGRITRFSKMPITVYVENLSDSRRNYIDDLNYSLKEWHDGSSDLLSFETVDKADGAAILISWSGKIEDEYRDHPLGMAELHRMDQGNYFAEIQICQRDPVTGKPLSNDQMKVVFLHEIGHAVGLWGHSKDKNDVMYYASNVLHPTINDIVTLKAVYSYENNYPIHELTISALKEDIDLDSSDAGLYYLLGSIYIDKKDYENGINSLKKCLMINPKYNKAHVILASAYRAIGQEKDAISEYMAIANANPSALIYNVIGVSYYESGDFAQALVYLKKAVELDRIYEPAKRNLYRIYLGAADDYISKKMYNKAIELLNEAVGVFPDRPEIFNQLGIVYSEMGRYDDALKQYEFAFRINPGFGTANNNIASCYNNIGIKLAESERWNEAITAYKKAIELAPDLEGPKKNITALYWNQAQHFVSIGKDKEALNVYIELLSHDPNNGDAYNNLGAIYSRLGNNKDAVTILEHALQIDPESEDVKSNLAVAHQKYGIELIEKRSYESALDQFVKTLELSPNNPDAYVCLAMIYEKLGKYDEATRNVGLALEIDPKNNNAKKIIWNLKIQQAEDYIKAKNYDKALECYTSIPNEMITPALHDNMAYIYIMKGMFIEAISEIEIALKSDPYDDTANKNLLSIESKLKRMLSQNSGSQKARGDLARTRLSIAMSYVNRGDLMKAKQILKSAIDLKSNDSEVMDLLNDGCRKLASRFSQKGNKKQSEEILAWQAD